MDRVTDGEIREAIGSAVAEVRTDMHRMSVELRGEMTGLSERFEQLQQKFEDARRHFEEHTARLSEQNNRHFEQHAARLSEDIRRHFEFYIEQKDRKFELVMEGYIATNQRIDREKSETREEIQSLDLRVTSLEKARRSR